MASIGVILAASVDARGRLDRSLRERFAACTAAYTAKRIQRILVTGSEEFAERPVAEMVREELIAFGVPAEDVIVPQGLENYEWNTEGDVRQAVDASLFRSEDTLVFFTDPFHYIFRVRGLARRRLDPTPFGRYTKVRWGGGIPPRPYDLVRELLGILVMRNLSPDARQRLRIFWKTKIAYRFTGGIYLGERKSKNGSRK